MGLAYQTDRSLQVDSLVDDGQLSKIPSMKVCVIIILVELALPLKNDRFSRFNESHEFGSKLPYKRIYN
ncbi:hypothetical protein AWA1501_31350 [Lactiplantibacillus pentosus]|nr:hypothetical protein AWA1501_31350 [Lactiplantibacillus pentosus]